MRFSPIAQKDAKKPAGATTPAGISFILSVLIFVVNDIKFIYNIHKAVKYLR